MATKKTTTKKSTDSLPIFKTAETMATVSGIGEGKLRELMDKNEIDFVRIGNRRLLTEEAIIDWYERNKISAADSELEVG
ncbi:helix-turn-helix domain-containing protein [Oscillospiraceae bacterium OttesenSCG-928-G22]|nr:helix-turn-helix domain-containing protein [Oscillospiraceae bacterium OttesenSCG-928-G22]